MPNSFSPAQPRPTVGVVIRFKDSAATLPAVLEALRSQSVKPDLILAVDSGSRDGSRAILEAAGARILDWNGAYHHSRVLNHALRHCPTDLVLVLSSHTVLGCPGVMERYVASFEDPRTACVSARWDGDPFYSDAVDWSELRVKGLKFCAIHSNSMGMLRRSLWERVPFDETLPTMEDGAWAVEQLRRGHVCRRLDVPFSYQRGGRSRSYIFAIVTFRLAARHGLRVAWLGVSGSLLQLTRSLFARRARAGAQADVEGGRAVWDRLRAWAAWRFVRPATE